MRIMHVMAGAKEGGAENIMLESVLALAEAGLNQHVVTRPDNQFRVQKFREAGIGVDVAAFNNTWPFPTRRVIGDAIKECVRFLQGPHALLAAFGGGLLGP